MRSTIRAVTVAAAVTLSLLTVANGTAHAGSSLADPDKSSAQGMLLDARAAARATGVIGVNSTWFTSLAAGASQTWTWNNANADSTYVVGFNPAGAGISSPCQFEVTSTRYVQQFGGEKEFRFTIKNVGSIECGTTVLLARINGGSIGSTGGLNPGQSQTWLWNNLPAGMTFNVGLTPSGATSTAPCQIQVARTWYVQQPGSDRELWFTLTNVGSIACQADVRLANTTGGSTFSTGSIGAGASKSWTWNNANPVTTAYLLGLTPGDASPSACQLEVTRLYYRQRINSDGSSERELAITVKNVGSVSCSGVVNLPKIEA